MMVAFKRIARWGIERAGYTIQRKPAPRVIGAPSDRGHENGGTTGTFDLYGKAVALQRVASDPRHLSTFDPEQPAEFREAFLLLNEAYERLRRSSLVHAHDHHVRTDDACRLVHEQLVASGIAVVDYPCDATSYDTFLEQVRPLYQEVGYEQGYGGVGGYFSQKAFEHWISAAYLQWDRSATVLDLACDCSPATEVLAHYRPGQFYKHDIRLRTDLANRTISGFGDAIESPDAFFDFIMAHCAIDNFEGQADTDVFREVTRILKPGGRILITPLHLATRFENVVALASPGLQVDEGAGLCIGLPGTLRFGRHYSVDALKRRVVDTTRGLRFEVVRVLGLPIERYAATATNRFMLVGTKSSPEMGALSVPEYKGAQSGPSTGSRYRSRFGGLWTDTVDAGTQVERKLARGEITSEEATLLASWIAHGYVILPQAIPPQDIADANADVDRIWTDGDPRIKVIRRPGEYAPLTPGLAAERLRALDIYAYYPSMLRLMFAPRILRFFQLIFERPPLAFQSLSFEQGSEQFMHRDTAFVVVTSPLEMAASWIALEDAHEGAGELMYYEGSHHLDDRAFGGSSKHWDPVLHGDETLDLFTRTLEADAAARGRPKRLFRPKAGDVLVWSADLLHGGAPITDSRYTRRSLVTHYCPSDVSPNYFAMLPEYRGRRLSGGCQYSSQHDILPEATGSKPGRSWRERLSLIPGRSKVRAIHPR